ncbi:MAG: hypothetical protein KDA22_01695, partial [Phycisphaerales bacterium]|nr:hypothetical protein [Phycisphaerales bacterium]
MLLTPPTDSTLAAGLSIPLGAVFLSGLVLWLAGGRILAALLTLIGLLAGGAFGWMAAESLQLSIPSWSVALAGAVIVAVVAALAYRVTLALVLSAIFAWCSVLAVSALASQGVVNIGPSAPLDTAITAPVATPATGGGKTLPASPEDFDQVVQDAAARAAINELDARIRSQLDAMTRTLESSPLRAQLGSWSERAVRWRDDAASWWRSRPASLRTLLLASAGTAAFLGLVVGLVATRWTAAVVTASTGALLMIASSLVLAGDLVSSMPSPLPPSLAVWTWVGLSMAGLALQWWL